jgi:hypothetical protein
MLAVENKISPPDIVGADALEDMLDDFYVMLTVSMIRRRRSS